MLENHSYNQPLPLAAGAMPEEMQRHFLNIALTAPNGSKRDTKGSLTQHIMAPLAF